MEKCLSYIKKTEAETGPKIKESIEDYVQAAKREIKEVKEFGGIKAYRKALYE